MDTLWGGQWEPGDSHSTMPLDAALQGLAAGSDYSKDPLFLEIS